MDLKSTVLLPKTEFPMKGSLPEREPKMVAHWLQTGLYRKILEKNEGRPIFTMPDGPPYANGDIHIGHALNKCLKDFTIKYRNMAGYQAAFIPGWDCHGLPIEQKVSKDLGSKAREKSPTEIRQLCRQEAQKWVDRQRQQFQRLGVVADWENPYLTMQNDYEAEEIRELARCLERGVLYRGEKPVYWCPTLQTALAEAEVEYHTQTSPSIYVMFDISEAAKSFTSGTRPVSVLIWTTTPWTLPANLAVAVHPEFEYQVFDTGEHLLLMAKELAEAVAKENSVNLKPASGTIKGAKLEGLLAHHPFLDRQVPFVLGEHVTLEAGTGVVHTAPGHGQDDYKVGLKYGLPVYSPVDGSGRYTSEFADMAGVSIWEANPRIIDLLKAKGRLLSARTFEHQYPHNWRTKTPLIFRATPQWFLAMDQDSSPIRTAALTEVDAIRFFPGWGEARLRAMVENRPDWCLSRQRIWGVPIPVFHCKKCDTPLAKAEAMYRVADAIEKEGLEAYHSRPESDFVGGESCSNCGHDQFRRGQDILDVWFDSGVCHAAVQSRRPELRVPADIYLEGSDQHRGWFQTSLLSSLASTGQAPFRALVTHGFVMDDKGRKMSKSLGNVVDPNDVAKQSGAEIVRLWSAYEDFGKDLGCGPESFARVTETYRRFRNTMRFLLGNLSDFTPSRDSLDHHEMLLLDRWILGRLNELIEKCTAGFESYEFFKVYHALNLFFTVDLSAGYLDMLKDRLYIWAPGSRERRSAQTALHILVDHLVRLMAPITTFLSEEVHGYLPERKVESVLLESYPQLRPEWSDSGLAGDMTALFEIRVEAMKVLEGLRQQKVIGSGLDAKLTIVADDGRFDLLNKYQGNREQSFLTEFFIVSQVDIKQGAFEIQASRADGQKCSRCWYHSESLGQSKLIPEICPKCITSLQAAGHPV
jgi:isoleucyl-tRNA synthetase